MNTDGMSDRTQGKMKNRLSIMAVYSLLSLLFVFPVVAAENNNNNNNNNKKPIQTEFPPNPLEIRVRDPLIPRSRRDKQPLTEEEKATLAIALDELNNEAAAKLQAGDQKGAFETWYRELRLRRYLGFLPEVQALGRVGGIAWERNLREDVQFISKRLQTIQQTRFKQPVNLDFLRALGNAFEQVRSPDWAVKVYEQVLAGTRQQQDADRIEETLLKIGDLSLSWFDYKRAISAYQELAQLAEQKRDRTKQVTYLKQLAYLYGKDSQIEKAISTKRQLIEFYRNEQDFAQIPIIQLDIAANYQAIGLLNQAVQIYQEAYAFAWSIQLYASAANALQKLMELQTSQRELTAAVETAQVLLQAEQLANNTYGLMNGYDEMAKLYLELKNYPQALVAFQNGLVIAKELRYREAYFSRQIQEVRRQANGS